MFEKYNVTIGVLAPLFLALSILSLSTFHCAHWWMFFSYLLFMICGIALLFITPEDVVCSIGDSRFKRKYGSESTTNEKVVQIIHAVCMFILTVCSLYPFFEKEYEGGVIVWLAAIVSFLVGLFATGTISLYVYNTLRPVTNSDIEWVAQQREEKLVKQAEIKAKEDEAKRKREEYESLVSSIGVPDKIIKMNVSAMYTDLVFFYKKKVLLYGFTLIKGEDILRYDVSMEKGTKEIPVSWTEIEEYQRKKELATTTVKTSTSSMLGRAVIGGVLFGGLGALAGAATAKKEVYSNHDIPEEPKPRIETFITYTVYVRLNNGREIKIPFNRSKDKMENFVRELNFILHQNPDDEGKNLK